MPYYFLLYHLTNMISIWILLSFLLVFYVAFCSYHICIHTYVCTYILLLTLCVSCLFWKFQMFMLQRRFLWKSFSLLILLCTCICRLTFLVAEACLIAGATRNAYHTKYRGMIYAQNFSCETLRKGVFIAGAVFVVATMILNVYYYMYFAKATTTMPAHKANRTNSTVGMTGYA